ncbi:MAG: hypothetical protein AMXMBFR56_65880 [Polyangiaceae bacterium]
MADDSPKLVTVEIKNEAPFCGGLVDALRSLAKSWAEVGACFASTPIRRNMLSYELTQGALIVTNRVTLSTATAEGRRLLTEWQKAGIQIVEEEEIR